MDDVRIARGRSTATGVNSAAGSPRASPGRNAVEPLPRTRRRPARAASGRLRSATATGNRRPTVPTRRAHRDRRANQRRAALVAHARRGRARPRARIVEREQRGRTRCSNAARSATDSRLSRQVGEVALDERARERREWRRSTGARRHRRRARVRRASSSSHAQPYGALERRALRAARGRRIRRDIGAAPDGGRAARRSRRAPAAPDAAAARARAASACARTSASRSCRRTPDAARAAARASPSPPSTWSGLFGYSRTTFASAIRAKRDAVARQMRHGKRIVAMARTDRIERDCESDALAARQRRSTSRVSARGCRHDGQLCIGAAAPWIAGCAALGAVEAPLARDATAAPLRSTSDAMPARGALDVVPQRVADHHRIVGAQSTRSQRRRERCAASGLEAPTSSDVTRRVDAAARSRTSRASRVCSARVLLRDHARSGARVRSASMSSSAPATAAGSADRARDAARAAAPGCACRLVAREREQATVALDPRVVDRSRGRCATCAIEPSSMRCVCRDAGRRASHAAANAAKRVAHAGDARRGLRAGDRRACRRGRTGLRVIIANVRLTPLRALAFFRSCSFRKRLRMRIDFGVTSTSSSSAMNSTAYSSVSSIGGDEAHRFVGARRADVGELLALDRIDDEVVVAAVDADDHAFVELLAGRHEHAAALLQLPQRVGDRVAVLLRNQHAVAALGDLALQRRVAVEHVAHEPGAARQVHELALEADQSARRNAVFETRAAAAVGLHVGEIAAPRAERFHHRALVLLLDVDRQRFVRLAGHAVDLAQHDARPRHRELVAFAAHVLDQDGEVQLAAARHEERRRCRPSPRRAAPRWSAVPSPAARAGCAT